MGAVRDGVKVCGGASGGIYKPHISICFGRTAGRTENEACLDQKDLPSLAYIFTIPTGQRCKNQDEIYKSTSSESMPLNLEIVEVTIG